MSSTFVLQDARGDRGTSNFEAMLHASEHVIGPQSIEEPNASGAYDRDSYLRQAGPGIRRALDEGVPVFLAQPEYPLPVSHATFAVDGRYSHRSNFNFPDFSAISYKARVFAASEESATFVSRALHMVGIQQLQGLFTTHRHETLERRTKAEATYPNFRASGHNVIEFIDRGPGKRAVNRLDVRNIFRNHSVFALFNVGLRCEWSNRVTCSQKVAANVRGLCNELQEGRATATPRPLGAEMGLLTLVSVLPQGPQNEAKFVNSIDDANLSIGEETKLDFNTALKKESSIFCYFTYGFTQRNSLMSIQWRTYRENFHKKDVKPTLDCQVSVASVRVKVASSECGNIPPPPLDNHNTNQVYRKGSQPSFRIEHYQQIQAAAVLRLPDDATQLHLNSLRTDLTRRLHKAQDNVVKKLRHAGVADPRLPQLSPLLLQSASEQIGQIKDEAPYLPARMFRISLFNRQSGASTHIMQPVVEALKPLGIDESSHKTQAEVIFAEQGVTAKTTDEAEEAPPPARSVLERFFHWLYRLLERWGVRLAPVQATSLPNKRRQEAVPASLAVWSELSAPVPSNPVHQVTARASALAKNDIDETTSNKQQQWVSGHLSFHLRLDLTNDRWVDPEQSAATIASAQKLISNLFRYDHPEADVDDEPFARHALMVGQSYEIGIGTHDVEAVRRAMAASIGEEVQRALATAGEAADIKVDASRLPLFAQYGLDLRALRVLEQFATGDAAPHQNAPSQQDVSQTRLDEMGRWVDGLTKFFDNIEWVDPDKAEAEVVAACEEFSRPTCQKLLQMAALRELYLRGVQKLGETASSDAFDFVARRTAPVGTSHAALSYRTEQIMVRHRMFDEVHARNPRPNGQTRVARNEQLFAATQALYDSTWLPLAEELQCFKRVCNTPVASDVDEKELGPKERAAANAQEKPQPPLTPYGAPSTAQAISAQPAADNDDPDVEMQPLPQSKVDSTEAAYQALKLQGQTITACLRTLFLDSKSTFAEQDRLTVAQSFIDGDIGRRAFFLLTFVRPKHLIEHLRRYSDEMSLASSPVSLAPQAEERVEAAFEPANMLAEHLLAMPTDQADPLFASCLAAVEQAVQWWELLDHAQRRAKKTQLDTLLFKLSEQKAGPAGRVDKQQGVEIVDDREPHDFVLLDAYV